MIQITSRAALEAVPSGSIITWLRIPGDDTSAAAAFIHHVDESEGVADAPVHRVTWVSPGGWSPMSVEEAGITYPVTVVMVGGETPRLPDPPVFEAPQFGEIELLTDYRRDALNAAVHWTQPTGTSLERTLEIAETMEQWLRAPEIRKRREQEILRGECICGHLMSAECPEHGPTIDRIREQDAHEQRLADERADVLEDWHGKATHNDG